MDRRSPEEQVQMGALVLAERMRCPAGHPLSLSLRDDLTLLVHQERCEWCRVLANFQEQFEERHKNLPGRATAGHLWSVTAKNGGPAHG